jgi:hypothetical protein
LIFCWNVSYTLDSVGSGNRGLPGAGGRGWAKATPEKSTTLVLTSAQVRRRNSVNISFLSNGNGPASAEHDVRSG